MKSLDPKLEDALRVAGAKLVRESKHLIYRLPNGKLYVCSKNQNPACRPQRQLAQLRNLLKESNTPYD